MIHPNPETAFCGESAMPEVDETAFVHPLAAVIGHVRIGRRVMVAPMAAVRADEGYPIFVGDEANIQDGVVIHALETEHNGQPIPANRVIVGDRPYAVHIGASVSLAHQCQIHGPARVGDHTFIGMRSLVFKSEVGQRCVVEPGCTLMGVRIPDGRFVPAGYVVTRQADADRLPEITDDYPLKTLNAGVVEVNVGLADGYNRMDLSR